MSTAGGAKRSAGDASDTRGAHFKAKLSERSGKILPLAAALALALAGLVWIGPLGAAIGFVLGAVGGLVWLWQEAAGAARADFFKAYAAERGLTMSDADVRIPGKTPLLRGGDERGSRRCLEGRWPSGFEGQIHHFTLTFVSRDSEGDRKETEVDFTIGLARIERMHSYLRELFIHGRSGPGFLDGREDGSVSRLRVEQESAELDRRFEIFIGANDDMNRARQVLEPSFILWLAEKAPAEFVLECVGGTLVTILPGHCESAVQLDRLAEMSHIVATRLREEAAE